MSNYTVAPAPHVHGGDSVKKNMLNVIIALIPAYLAGCWYFGLGALIVSCVAMVSCVAFEWLISKFILKKQPFLFILEYLHIHSYGIYGAKK